MKKIYRKDGFFSEENIIDLLYLLNSWWKSGAVQKEFDEPMKRVPYYEANKILKNKEIRRTVLLSGARRTGKTTIMYQTIAALLNEGVLPNIFYLFHLTIRC